MQSELQVFLALLLAHLLADFPLQSSAMVRAKKTSWKPCIKHGLTHYFCALGCLLLFTAEPMRSLRVQGLLVLYVLAHIATDVGKQLLVRNHVFPDHARLFLADQAIHVAIVAGIAWGVTRATWAEVQAVVLSSAPKKLDALVTAVVYTAVLFGGGYLIRYCTRSLSQPLVVSQEETREELQNAGLYIGWLERFLVITALLMQSPALVGLILTGKSVARFPELKDARFAEYFLIGTLLSISIALLGGLLLLHYFHGVVSLQ
jgi:hypothetical protein